MPTVEQIRLLTVRGRTEGLDRVAGELAKVEGAQRGVAAAGDQAATTSETSARRQLSAAAGLRRVEGQLDGATRATRTYEAQIRTLNRALEQGGLTQARYAQLTKEAEANLVVATANAQQRMAARAANANDILNPQKLEDVGKAARLTSNQMLNLSRQGNDVVTMFALGASPMQIFASQAGQVYDALSAGPGGLKGGLQAIGTELGLLAARWGPLALGAGAVAGATYLVWKAASGPEVKSAEEALEAYAERIKALEDGYKAAAEAATDYFQRNRPEGPDVALAGVQGTEAELRATLAREIEVLTQRTQSFITSFKDLTPAVLAGQQSVRDLGNQLASGEITAAQFREQIARIRIDPQTPRVVVEIADKLLDGSANARDLAIAVEAIGEAANVAGERIDRMTRVGRFGRGNFDSTLPGSRFEQNLSERLGDGAGMASIREGLIAQADALRKVSDEATKEYVRAAKEREAAIFKEVEAVIRHQQPMIEFGEKLSVDRASLFMSDDEAQIAATLRPFDLAMDSVEAQYIRQTQMLKSFREANREAWTGIGSDILVNGVQPVEAIGNAFDRLNARLVDQIFTGAADSVFAAIFGGANNPLTSIPTQATVGLTAANAMWVRSADGGVGGAGGAIERLLSPANGNQPASGMAAYREAIAAIESRGSGDYSAVGPTSARYGRALGRYQVMEANVGPWSEAALGKRLSASSFLANPGYQDAVFDHRFGGYVDKYGAGGAAQAWFGGEGSISKLGRKDSLGTSVGQYAERFEAELAKLPDVGADVAKTGASFAGGLAQTTGAINAGIGQIADQFVPGFGGILQQLLGGMSKESGGGVIGGILSSAFGGGGFGTGTVSSGATTAILSGSFGGLFADGGFLGAGKWGIAGERGPEPVIGPAQIVAHHRVPRMQAPGQAQAAPMIQQTFVNAPPVKDTREESDGRGGRRQTIVFDEAVAGTLGRPNSKSSRAVGSEFGLKKRLIK